MTDIGQTAVTIPFNVTSMNTHGVRVTRTVETSWSRTGIAVPVPASDLTIDTFVAEGVALVGGLGWFGTTVAWAPWWFSMIGAVISGWTGVMVARQPRRLRYRRAALDTFQQDWRARFDCDPPKRLDREWVHDGVVYRVHRREVVSLPLADHPHRRPTQQSPQQITAQADTATRHARASEQHEQISQAYGAILADPIEVLLHSALMDTTNPHTEQFVLALYSANDLATATRPSNVAEVEQYAAAVHRLRVAWDNARGFAEKHGAAWMPGVDQERVDTALGLLRHGASPGLSDTERITYLTKAYTLIRDISVLRLDPRTVAALDAATGKAITG